MRGPSAGENVRMAGFHERIQAAGQPLAELFSPMVLDSVTIAGIKDFVDGAAQTNKSPPPRPH